MQNTVYWNSHSTKRFELILTRDLLQFHNLKGQLCEFM